ncbi:hypothetical protein PFICI_10234 [Pestalotiopsis fici W106-1]|uniref:Nuclear membrane fusion protein Kar5 n=1 Tax=Pestalotiopsis fici (strain W106-1 / CGMCC3.15140) TaxID=1229662 RepID=W3WYG7_PESFW|nr:uncharacterized protein PFICI_10234 [Pestalotiopsis fici W106-1]ETS78172.1 hypothetical protein PFICI_10234 [Pestalotiopsis fici W106-1]
MVPGPVFIALLVLAGSHVAAAFGWRGQPKVSSQSHDSLQTRFHYDTTRQPNAVRNPMTVYEIALRELQQLESEPACHRTAARLLVDNCQVLDGKDEATILTDSGRQIRDFVDAYAASLAICDLERGSFIIPTECENFREPTLRQLSLGDSAHLHVSSKEIDRCLSGLGASDSGWNTWISYRHKALRFCEAARAENEKAEHIRIFQRVAKIMNGMAEGVEQQVEKRMADLEHKFRATDGRLEQLSPKLDRISAGLHDIDSIMTVDLASALQRSADTVDAGMNSAANLQRALEILLETVLSTIAEAASAHEKSISIISERTNSEFSVFLTAMNTAVASASSLQNQIDLAHRQSAELEYRQAHLEEGMVRLIDVTEILTGKYDQHTHLLQGAQNMTQEILDTLEVTASSASTIGDTFARQSSVASWWPYVWCPAASLVMGSYGLAPSAARNLALVALGEIMGFVVSSAQSLSLVQFSTFKQDFFSAMVPATFFMSTHTTPTYDNGTA